MYIPRAPFGPRVQCRRVGKVSFFFSSVKVDVFSQVWMAEDKPDDSWRRGDRRRKCEVAQRADTTMRLAGKQEKKEGGGIFPEDVQEREKERESDCLKQGAAKHPGENTRPQSGLLRMEILRSCTGPGSRTARRGPLTKHTSPASPAAIKANILQPCELSATRWGFFSSPLRRSNNGRVCVCVRECARQAGKENA